MKILKLLMKLLLFIVGVLVSLWLLMPWGKVGEYAVLSAEKIASSKGFNTQHSSVSGSWRGPNIIVNDFTSKMALGGGEFKTLSFTPSFPQSMIQLAPVMSISFTGGKLSFPGGIDADIGSGNVEVSYKNGILFIRNLKNTGELSFDGSIAIDINSTKIDHADLMIKSPESIEQSLDSMKSMLPLTQESNGQWRLRRDK
ncbi:MAG: hypothetical protein FWE49_01440 [Synergistaceae bacterium]|nr:hypothetical protein [Synergistaceae bacterium]